MNALEKIIVKLCLVVLWVSMSIIFVVLTINTVLRYGGGKSLQWANEVPELLFPWLVMAGVVLAAVRGAHITTSFLMDGLSTSVRRYVGIGGSIIVAALYSTLFVATWRLLDIVHDERSPILGLPGSITYGCVMVGLGLLAVLAVLAAWRAFTGDGAATPAASENPHW
jgi:TRAP-type transport system small permease protein